MIRLRDVSKVFCGKGLETRALDHVQLTIERGEFLGILGPSGGGKSTLLSIIGLLDSPTNGTYELNGRTTVDLSPKQRARLRNQSIGFVFQNFNLIGDLDLFQNVELPLTYAGVSPSERADRVASALARVGLTDRDRHFPAELSGGQQQRVAIARAVVTEPDILLADEPTGNLDSRHGETIMNLLAELHRDGTTICLVTHDSRYAAFADRRVELVDGRIVNES
ncbi:ABC transporter ATP-binding protein [Sulfidibacter corallicola]|uniref:ABC transporter ATP-binding protein n=1 Tax=Sulfidibacter corallicola TaxID=2818388 RepID=A0A8A4U6L9_SULCO|nr:ABC transporter ATP-binding protein [Sulfidibacter corallicola]